MVQTIAERFAGPVNPELWSWRGPKTMSVHWYGGVIREYARSHDVVGELLDCEGMNAELSAIWKSCKPLCARRASFSYGGYGGHLSCVPHAAGEQAVAVVRTYFTRALEWLPAEQLSDVTIDPSPWG
jgi:hypothetical protein